jgi:hypothetical protein
MISSCKSNIMRELRNNKKMSGLDAYNSLRPAHAPNKAMDIKDAWWGAYNGQDAHLWDGQNSWAQSWSWK